MKRVHIMSLSKIVTDLCVIRKTLGLKTTFSDTVYNVLLVKGSW